MDIKDIKTFLLVAENENIQKTAAIHNLNPSTISKAIKRIEDENGIRLFIRERKGIKLSSEGVFFKSRFREMVNLYSKALSEVKAHESLVTIRIALPQTGIFFLQPYFKKILKIYPKTKFEFVTECGPNIVKRLLKSEVDLIVTSFELPSNIVYKQLGDLNFKTYVGEGHPLYSFAKKKNPVHIKEVLSHPFVIPKDNFLIQDTQMTSLDGWNEEAFPRRVSFIADNLTAFQYLIENGMAMAYLPEVLTRSISMLPLKITGCTFKCKTKLKIACKNPEEFGWANAIF